MGSTGEKPPGFEPDLAGSATKNAGESSLSLKEHDGMVEEYSSARAMVGVAANVETKTLDAGHVGTI